MPYLEATIIGLKCEVYYQYNPPENGHREYVTIETIECECRGCDKCIDIDPNELHKSQFDALEKEALRHYKECGL